MIRQVFCLLVLGFAACSPTPVKEKKQAIPVHVTTVSFHDLAQYIQGYGSLEAKTQAEIRSQVQGLITKIHYIEGQRVQKGDLLIEIDPTFYQLKLDEAQSALEEKVAQRDFLAEKLRRYLSLSDDILPAIERKQLQKDVALSDALVKAHKARLQLAALERKSCSLYAPISGYIGRDASHEHAWVSQKTLLNTIRNFDLLSMEFTVEEKDLPLLSLRSPLDVRAAGDETWISCAELISLDNTLDRSSGNIAAKALLSNQDLKFRPGQFVQWRLLTKREEDLAFLPMEAIQQGRHGSFVYNIDSKGKAKQTPVILGQEEEKRVVIVAGLEPKDQVVIKGQTRLYPGALVEIIP